MVSESPNIFHRRALNIWWGRLLILPWPYGGRQCFGPELSQISIQNEITLFSLVNNNSLRKFSLLILKFPNFNCSEIPGEKLMPFYQFYLYIYRYFHLLTDPFFFRDSELTTNKIQVPLKIGISDILSYY